MFPKDFYSKIWLIKVEEHEKIYNTDFSKSRIFFFTIS